MAGSVRNGLQIFEDESVGLQQKYQMFLFLSFFKICYHMNL